MLECAECVANGLREDVYGSLCACCSVPPVLSSQPAKVENGNKTGYRSMDRLGCKRGEANILRRSKTLSGSLKY